MATNMNEPRSAAVTAYDAPLRAAADAPAAKESSRAWQHLGALGLFCLLTGVMVTPLARDPVTLTAGWEGDNAFCIRQFWWAKRAIVDLRASPFFDPSSYYPVGHTIVNGEMFPATTFPGIPLTALWGPVVAYNVTLLLTFVLTGFGTYLWIARLTGSAAGGIVAGVVAAFLPFRFAHLPGHLSMVSTHWMPFALYSFERFLARKTSARAAVLGVCVAMVALSSWYYAYAVGLMLPVYALVRSRPWREHWNAEWWRGLAVAAASAALLVLPFLIPYLGLRSRGGLTRGIAEMESWSINFYDFFLPNRFNPAWAEFVLRWFPQEGTQWVERGVSLGYTALALALVAFFARRRHPAVQAILAVWALSFAVALGPTLHSGDRPILVPMPRPVTALAAKVLERSPSLERVRTDILNHQAFAIPMPSLFLFIFVPMTNGMRVMARFGIWTGIMTAGLAGWGTYLLLERMRRRFGDRRVISIAVVTALCALVLAESRSEISTMPMTPRGVDLWLAQQPPDVAVIDLPLEQTFRPLQNYYKTVHQHPTAFGPVGDGFMPPIFEARKAAVADFPSTASVAALREWRVRYVLLTPSQIPDWPAFKQKIEASPGLRFDREIEDVQVYALR
jgi:hypothetical protein